MFADGDIAQPVLGHDESTKSITGPLIPGDESYA
jgi:hypothetical protein